MNHEIKPVATFGDLVQVAGYGNNLFAVEAFTYEYHHEPFGTFTEVIYDLTCVYGDSGYVIGEQEDVTLACKAEKSDAFLQAYKPTPTAEDKPNIMSQIYRAVGNGGNVMAKKQPKPPTKQAQIDTLLDELDAVIQTRELMRDIGHADVAEYERRADDIKAKLAEVSG